MAVVSTGFTNAVSGLSASGKALEVTAHNLTNADTTGYTRQRVEQTDAYYSNLGTIGNQQLKVGTGVSITKISQIRNMFLDMSYREEASTKSFYEASMYGVNELEAVLGETIDGTSFSEILGNMWETLNELNKHPDGIEARAAFVQSGVLFADQANQIAEQFKEYQITLNNKVYSLISEVNSLSEKISNLNTIIAEAEASGGSANDYRDERNNCLDRLAEIISIKTTEDSIGMISVSAEGHQVVDGGSYVKMEAQILSPNEPFYQPVWEDSQMNVLYEAEISSKNDNDKGELKGVVSFRGSKIVDYTYIQDPIKYDSIKDSVLLKTMAQFDQLVNHVATTINDIIAPSSGNGPYGLDGSQGIALFLKTDPLDPSVAGNLEINTDILNDVAKLCLSQNKDDVGDSSIVRKILDDWNKQALKLDPNSNYEMNVQEYYQGLVNELGSEGTKAISQYENQTILVNQINGQRLSVMGVSSDEELSKMIMYQQAYNANAKVISVIDEMIEHLINKLG